ncbi:HAD hydrolase-like protein [Paenibacillus sp. YPG26]|uniref:HAD family hydrolase n=1 Tax=Paenibacillus sp. YPG26 TaxID=2878915 RepID=UPI00203F2FC9|nr:HAD hydrolase-like protein [Paenibacillus sp. YPG26]USB32401.1 HAD hydrolase-like protein [Paenibacillus sp. YPG26]
MEITRRLNKPEAMIFDMDGTLFKTETLLVPAYHRMFEELRRQGLYEGEEPPVSRLIDSVGMVMDEIWARVLPDHDESVRQRADELFLENEMKGLKEDPTELYGGVADTLRSLREQGVRLFVASNGLEPYVKGVADAHQIMPLFEQIYSAGEYQTASKVHLVELLLRQHGLKKAWMVGDRSSDVKAGKENGLTVIGCAYAGFCDDKELDGSDTIIRSFGELLDLYEHSV